MSNWCEQATKEVHETYDLRDIEQLTDNFYTQKCKDKYLLRIFSLKTPESITNHIVLDEQDGVTEIPVPIRDFEGLVELNHTRFFRLYQELVDYIKEKLNQQSIKHNFTITNDTLLVLLDLIIDIEDNDYFTFNDDSRVNLFQQVAQKNKQLKNLDTIRYTISVESYLIELISYFLYDLTYQPIGDHGIITMDMIRETKNTLKNILEESPDDNEININELVILPVFKIAKIFEFPENVGIYFKALNEQDQNDFKYFIKRFYNAVVKDEASYKISDLDLFVFYFVMGLKKLIRKNISTVTDNYDLTAKDHINWLHDNFNYKNKTIDVYYNEFFDAKELRNI